MTWWFTIFCVGMLIMALGSVIGELMDRGRTRLISFAVGMPVSVIAMIGMAFTLGQDGGSLQ